MHTTTRQETGVPEGYTAIPIHKSGGSGPLQLCVLVRQTPDPVAGQLVQLRELYDARVFLGCVQDAAGRVREWLELWVQNVDGLEASLPAFRETFSNFSLDERWVQQTEAFRKLNAGAFLATGWEASHPAPMFLDLVQGTTVEPGDPKAGGPWVLCREDQALQAAGLPAYSTSLFRYLYQPAAGTERKFVPVTSGAPENGATQPAAAALAGLEHDVAFNGQGGLMMVLNFSPLSYEEYADLLGGKAWAGVEHGKKRLSLQGPLAALMDWNQAQQDNAHLFLGLHGRPGRFVETFHLKLQLLTEAVRQAQNFVQQQQLPFLNLGADSFRVNLGQAGTGLPTLWTARASLVRPGAAFALPVESNEFRYFIRPGSTGASIYLPEGLSAPVQGSGSVRIRKVNPPEQGRTVLEGTMVVQERLAVSPHDLLWIRLPLPSGRVDLYGHLYAAESLAQGEIRFRTVAQRLPEAALTALKGAEGVSFARSPFEVVPLLSTPCDLYALGVLGVRTLLVDDTTTLAVALDELLSLARQLAAEHKAEVPLGTRIRTLFERDPRYAASLGPHRLSRGGLSAEEASRLLPLELWCDTLAVLVSLFPGVGPDSVCRDYGDVPALALETVFQRPVEALEKLLLRSRGLVVIDWTYNQEVKGIIQKFQQVG